MAERGRSSQLVEPTGKGAMQKSRPEEMMEEGLLEFGFPAYTSEYRFHPKWRFRFDFAFVDYRVALEIQGGTWMKKGRHTHGIGYEKDQQKLEEAHYLGWHVLCVTKQEVEDGRALSRLHRALKERGWNDGGTKEAGGWREDPSSGSVHDARGEGHSDDLRRDARGLDAGQLG